MTDGGLMIVQFVHPGFEYHKREHVGPRKQRSGIMPWKDGGTVHDRKFMWTLGSGIDPQSQKEFQDVPLTMWGEWEGPSLFWRIGSPGKPLASIVHAPFRPANVPTRPVQNTDPMVFGDRFIYSNCRQPRHRILRSLPSGSLILFGRLSEPITNPSFSLDTCFVVDSARPLKTIPFDPTTYGQDLLEDAALCALFSEGKGEQAEVGVHTGRTKSQGDIYSFVPVRLAEEGPSLFARPELRPVGALENVISPGTQATNMTHGIRAEERDAIWQEVVNQVVEQECMLGYYAAPPPLLDESKAERLTEGPPRPLKGDLLTTGSLSTT